jgi:Flp pilus assembly protein TadD
LGAFDRAVGVSLYGRVANAMVQYIAYLAKAAAPFGLTCHYPHPGDAIPLWKPIGSAAVLAAATICFLFQAKRRPYLIVGWLWYLGVLTPVVGFVPIGDHSSADRYTDLPLIGVYWMIAWSLAELAQHKPHWRARIAGGAVLTLAILAVLTARQTGYWRDSKTLFEHAVAVEPNDSLSHMNLAFMLEREGRIEEAARHFERAAELDPLKASPAEVYANSLARRGRLDKADQEFQRAIELDPIWAVARRNYGLLLVQRGRLDDAERQIEEAVRLEPDSVDARFLYAKFLAGRGRLSDAVAQLKECIRLEPDEPTLQSMLQQWQARESGRSAGAVVPQ